MERKMVEMIDTYTNLCQLFYGKKRYYKYKLNINIEGLINIEQISILKYFFKYCVYKIDQIMSKL